MKLGRLTLFRFTIGLGPTPDGDTHTPQITQHDQQFLVYGATDRQRGLWEAR